MTAPARRVWLLTWIVFGVGLCAAGPARAQSDDQPRLRGSVVGGGTGVFAPEDWGVVRAHVANPSEADRELRVVFHFEGKGGRQFVRHAWVPPHARRKVTWPARATEADRDARSLEGSLILMPMGEERELSREPGTLRLDHEEYRTLVMSDAEDDPTLDAVTGARLAAGLSKRMLFISDRSSPRFDLGWSGVAVLTMTTDEPRFDASQRRAVRRWLRGGGTMLVFADQVSGDAMQLLLGDSWGIEFIDQVTLNSLAFEMRDEPGTRVETVTSPCEVEEPITMTRLVAPDYDVHATVRGWPALISRRVGSGQLIVATVNGRAWNAPETAEALRALGKRTFPARRPEAAVLPADQAEPFIAQQVGYEIAGRWTIAMILAPYVGLFVIAGLWLGYRHRLEQLGLIGAVLAVATTLVLVAVGRARIGELQPTRAALQLVKVGGGGEAAEISGLFGLFDPAGDPTGDKTQIISDNGGWAWPKPTGEQIDLVRMVWHDLDRWEWKQVRLPAGAVRPVSFALSSPFARRLKMDLTLESQGLMGQIEWPQTMQPSEMLLATLHGQMRIEVVKPADPTVIAARPSDVLPSGVFLGSGVVGPQSQARSQVVAALLEQRQWLAGPTLLAWARGLETHFHFADRFGEKEEALWVVPIKLTPAEPGATVTVPWPLVRMEAMKPRRARQMFGVSAMPLYRADVHQWIEGVTAASAFAAAFFPPKPVMPLKPTGGRLHVDITAIGRPVRVLGLSPDGQVVEAANVHGPDGQEVFELPAEALNVRPDGSILIAVDVGQPPTQITTETSSAMWSIRQLGLEVSGEVLESSTPAPSP